LAYILQRLTGEKRLSGTTAAFANEATGRAFKLQEAVVVDGSGPASRTKRTFSQRFIHLSHLLRFNPEQELLQ
jgi:hypothetical protein